MAPRFEIRSAARDREADRMRFGAADKALAALVADLQKERAGLELRHQRMTDDAGFSMQALEDRGKTRLSAQVDDMAFAMKAYRDRLAEIDHHLALAASLRAQLNAYLAGKALLPA